LRVAVVAVVVKVQTVLVAVVPVLEQADIFETQ
jgi:hypothetical protein